MKNPFRKKALGQEFVVPSVKGGLGTFGGVFTPSILTILGVIMYLRFGWVVGNVGLIDTLLIVTLSCAITLLTALSIAAIATVLTSNNISADLVFLGMAEPGEKFNSYYDTLQKRLKDLPTTVMVLAAEEISFGEVLMQQDTLREG